MRKLGALLLLAMASCSGRYAVGIEPMPDASGGSGGAADTTGAGGAGTTGAGGAAAGAPGSGGGPLLDAAAPSRCGFTPDLGASSAPTASSMVVFSRIHQFLDDAPATPAGALPAQPTPAWAADEAMATLDGHLAAGTEARGLARFLTSWLNVQNTDAGPSLADSWSVKLLDPGATLATLLASPTGEPHRIGIFTERSLLTVRPTISPRGAWMSQALFCAPIPPPPANVPVSPPPPPGLTRRQVLERDIASSPVCVVCHDLMDPPGDSLEHFDSMGNYRDVDNGQPVDSSGTLKQSTMTSFTSYDDLAPKLATSCDVAQCFSRSLMNDAFGVPSGSMPPFTDAELNHVANVFADSNFSIRALVTAIVGAPSFLR